eukprot:6203989-Pleurochrysis_carterae.AAC.1
MVGQLNDVCSAHATTTHRSQPYAEIGKRGWGRVVPRPKQLMLLRTAAATPHRTRTTATMCFCSLFVRSKSKSEVQRERVVDDEQVARITDGGPVSENAALFKDSTERGGGQLGLRLGGKLLQQAGVGQAGVEEGKAGDWKAVADEMDMKRIGRRQAAVLLHSPAVSTPHGDDFVLQALARGLPILRDHRADDRAQMLQLRYPPASRAKGSGQLDDVLGLEGVRVLHHHHTLVAVVLWIIPAMQLTQVTGIHWQQAHVKQWE